MKSLVIVTEAGFGGALDAARAVGDAAAIVVGSRDLANAVAAAGVSGVRWVDAAAPAEAYTAAVIAAARDAGVRLLVSTTDPAGRVLSGACAAALGTPVVPNVVRLVADGHRLLVGRSMVNGGAVMTYEASGPVAAIYAGDDVEADAAGAAPITRLEAEPTTIRELGCQAAGESTGLADAARVVSFGRGVRAKGDVALVRGLADALAAEVACSMPVADDLGWLEKARYVGRSGQHIAPQLYLMLGIDGAPQHMEGVRDAKVVVAVNNNPEARVFRTADYGSSATSTRSSPPSSQPSSSSPISNE
jgi:electron transfer flavoprotein alpha subunit